MDASGIQSTCALIRNNINKVIIGKDTQIDLIIAALLSGGHVLIEDNPGTGKTMLALALAKSFDLAFGRIQFTPDLLPQELTGFNFYSPKTGEFAFRKGALFTNILLADEINRATPRTQSSLLESMEEHQVTVEGRTYKLEEPFMVIATQNPIEVQGTFPLPEAQLDRFFMRLSLGYPALSFEMEIMNSFMAGNPLEETQVVASREDVLNAKKSVTEINVSQAVKNYILKLIDATRNDDKIRLGVSTRGALALLRAAQGHAAVSGRDYVTPDDVKQMAEGVLAHRLIVKGSSIYSKALSNSELINNILNSVPVPTEDGIAFNSAGG